VQTSIETIQVPILPASLALSASQDWQEHDCHLFIEQISKHLPTGVALKPWHMLPIALWSGRHANMLRHDLNFHPFGRLNVMLMPADEMSSITLDLPQHPGDPDADYVGRAERTLDKIAAQVNSQASGTTTLAVTDAVILAAANMLADSYFGRAAYMQHLKLFGSALGWAHARKLQ
jgi:hypothetical protein